MVVEYPWRDQEIGPNLSSQRISHGGMSKYWKEGYKAKGNAF